MPDVTHDHPCPLSRAVDLEICGHAAVERERPARGRRDAGPWRDQRPEGPAGRTDEGVLRLRADEVRLWLAARVRALEREQGAGGRERTTEGEGVTAIENALAGALRPAVDRGCCVRRFPPDDCVTGEARALPQHSRLIRAEPGQQRN